MFVSLRDKHPVIVLKDVKVKFLLLILEYVYCGTVDLATEDVEEFKRVASSMEIKVSFNDEHGQTSDHNEELMMSQETIDDGEMPFEEEEDDTMQPSYEDIMGIPESSLTISSVESLSRGPKRLGRTLSELKEEPLMKKTKTSQEPDNRMMLLTRKPAKTLHIPVVPANGQCVYCDKPVREKDRNYHQKFCWKNLNRITSNCSICARKFEFPSKLRLHFKTSHPGIAFVLN